MVPRKATATATRAMIPVICGERRGIGPVSVQIKIADITTTIMKTNVVTAVTLMEEEVAVAIHKD